MRAKDEEKNKLKTEIKNFQRFPGISNVFPAISNVFPGISNVFQEFPMFSMIFQCLSYVFHDFPMFFHDFPMFSMIFQCFSMIFQCHPDFHCEAGWIFAAVWIPLWPLWRLDSFLQPGRDGEPSQPAAVEQEEVRIGVVMLVTCDHWFHWYNSYSEEMVVCVYPTRVSRFTVILLHVCLGYVGIHMDNLKSCCVQALRGEACEASSSFGFCTLVFALRDTWYCT